MLNRIKAYSGEACPHKEARNEICSREREPRGRETLFMFLETKQQAVKVGKTVGGAASASKN